ncbi:MAG: heparan-alpha-glucosaminide N-acetyltransferase domain-containing protein [Eubacteriales bacterium]
MTAIASTITPINFLFVFFSGFSVVLSCERMVPSVFPKSVSAEILKIFARAMILSIVGWVCPVSQRLILCLETPSFSANSS